LLFEELNCRILADPADINRFHFHLYQEIL
jgi:hypothetical protein